MKTKIKAKRKRTSRKTKAELRWIMGDSREGVSVKKLHYKSRAYPWRVGV